MNLPQQSMPSSSANWPCQWVLGRHLVVARLKDVVAELVAHAAAGATWRVAHVNVHMVMEAIDHPEFAAQLDQFDLQLPDGRPLVWLLRRRPASADAGQMRGLDTMLAICREAELQQVRVGIYGGSDASHTQAIVQALRDRFPKLPLVFWQTPPFGEQVDSQLAGVAADISQTRVQVLFVALGCPKQEQWIARQQLPCMQIGVGAAIDFLTGRKRQAPKLLQKLGLEWCWRLLAEPHRLWRRYLKQNPRFVWHLLRHWWQAKKKTST